MKPTISVVIPTYNRAHFIGDAIRSVLAQTVQPLEIIIVDDGSTDDTFTVVNEIAQYYPAVRHIRQDNQGVSVARNTGIKAASGDWIAFLDSDDTWPAHTLAKLSEVVERADDIAVAFGRAENVQDGQCTDFIHDPAIVAELSNPDSNIQRILFRASVVPVGAVMVRREVLLRYPFDATLKTAEDYDLWLRLAQDGVGFGYVNAVLLNRNLHGGNLVGQKDALNEAAVAVLSRYAQKPEAACRLSALRYDLGSAYLKQREWSKAKAHLSKVTHIAGVRRPVLMVKRMAVAVIVKLTPDPELAETQRFEL